MRKVLPAIIAIAVLVCPAAAGAADRYDVYVGDVPRERLSDIVALGIDRHELELKAIGGAKGSSVRVEVILSNDQAAELRRDGIDMDVKRIDGQSVAQRATALAAQGMEVFRTYAGADGLKAEFEQMARDHRKIAKLQSIGQHMAGPGNRGPQGHQERPQPPRRRASPAVLYIGAQHAREWITPGDGAPPGAPLPRRLQPRPRHPRARRRAGAVVRAGRQPGRLRLLLHPGTAAVAQEPARQRRRRRDHRGRRRRPQPQLRLSSGATTTRARHPTRRDLTYRGPGPNSEPETQALDAFVRRVGFEFFVNYHSAAQLLLYGTGWQVATPTPDDVIAEALAGDDAEPAVEGYDPDISAELYTTNGDTDTHMTENYGVFGFTPEMSTCEAASDSVPDDEWEAADCGSGFEFPDDEALVQAEFEKNIPFALSIAESADDPDDPESVDRPRGRRTSASTPSRSPTATRRRWPWWPSASSTTCACTTASTAAARTRRRVARVARRRALRRRERPLLRRVPRPGPRRRPR